MKTMIACGILAVSLISTSVSATPYEIDFQHTDWKSALEKAKSAGKGLYIDAWAPWCGPCRMMASETFTDSAVAAYMNDKFVAVKIDMDSDEADAFRAEHDVEYLPTSFFFSPAGELLFKETGYKSPEQFLSLARRVFGEDPVTTEHDQLEARFLSGDSSMTVMGPLLMKKLELVDTDNLFEVSNAIVAKSTTDQLMNDTVFSAFYLGTQSYDHPFSVYTRNNYQQLEDKHGMLAYKKGVEIILTGLQESIATGDKTRKKEATEFYLKINPDGKKKEVRKVYRTLKKEARS